MSENKELNDMPIWQNHEQRITALEVTTANIKNEFTEIKDKIDQGNAAQSQKLDRFYEKMTNEFFKKKSRNHENTWKLILKVTLSLIGSGSFIYLIIEKILGG